MSQLSHRCRVIGRYLIILLCLTICIHCRMEKNKLFSDKQQQPHSTLFHSLSSLNTSAIILPITYLNNQWIIPSSAMSLMICADALITDANDVPLSILLHHLPTNTATKLHILSLANISIKHIQILSQIMSTTRISELIIPSSMNTLQISTYFDIAITTYFETVSVMRQRRLLTNMTHNITHILIPKESWVCNPWPIYVGFFCGIGITVLVTIAIRFSMGDQDRKLMNALEKVVTTGINQNELDEYDPNKDDGFPELNLFAFTRSRSHRSVSSHVTTPRHGRDRVRSRARSKQMRENRKKIGSLSLDQFNESIVSSMDLNNGINHRSRRVTFEDEMRSSQKMNHVLQGSDLDLMVMIPQLPSNPTTLGSIPSAAEVSPDKHDGDALNIMFSDAVDNAFKGKGSNDSFAPSGDSLSSLMDEKEIEIAMDEDLPPMHALHAVLSDSGSEMHDDEVDGVVDFIQNEVIYSGEEDA
eukprot:12679_1